MDFKSNEELIEFLNIDIKEKDAIDRIFKIIMDYLIIFKDLNFDYDSVIPFNGIMNKYINCARYLGADTGELKLSIKRFLDLANESSKYSEMRADIPMIQKVLHPIKYQKRIVQLKGGEKKSKENVFYEIYNQVVLVYNSIKDFSKEQATIELEGFYNPNISNKKYAKKLIKDAIELIDKNDTLSDKSKKSIIEYLKKALDEIDKSNSNWSLIFGKLRETIFVLGALGSLAGGITGVVGLNEAKQKLEEATEVIENTSININYGNINQLFNTKNSYSIECNQPKLLLEKNSNDDKNESSIGTDK